MISLIKGLWMKYFDPPLFKILIIGMDGAGKTTLLNKLKQLANMPFIQFNKIPKTVGLNMSEFNYQPIQQTFNRKYKVLYWDLGGSITQRSIWKKYYPECHGIIFMIDGNKSERWEEVKNCFKYADKIQLFLNDKSHDQVPILIIINEKNNRESTLIQKVKELIQNIDDRQVSIQIINVLESANLFESIKLLHNEIGQLYMQYN